MRLTPATWLCLCMALAVACGGRYAGSGDGGDDPSTSSSGKSSSHAGRGSSSAGTSSSGGTASSIGGGATSGGAIAVAGSFAIAGAPGCGPCMLPMCPAGSPLIISPGECCPRCAGLDCRNVNCAMPVCPPNGHIEQPPDSCCPICVANQNCDKQRAGYFEFRKQLIEKYSSLGCMSALECDVMYENNACSSGCGEALPAAYVKDAMSNLDSYAQMTCSMCPPVPVPPCEPPGGVGCLNGRCVLF